MHYLSQQEACDIIQDHIYEAHCTMGDNILMVAGKIVFLAGVACIHNKMIVANIIEAAGGVRYHQAKYPFFMKIASN